MRNSFPRVLVPQGCGHSTKKGARKDTKGKAGVQFQEAPSTSDGSSN